MKIREFSRDRTTASWMGREAMYLIEPAALEAPDAMLAAWRAIVSNDRAAAAPVLGPQRYLVKQPGPASHGFRAVYEERLRHRWRTLGSKHEVFAVSTGTNALRVALRGVRAMADRPGLEVLVPATTVANTIEAVMMEGLVPVLVDIDPHTWLVDLDAAADAVGERTLALVSVDWLGTGVDVDAVGAFCRRHDIAWISDSAQSFGIEHGGRPPVTHADVTTFSTGYPKIFHTGGRGGLVVARREIVERLVVDAHGVLRNEPLPELNAIAGLDLLRDFDDILSHRRAIGDLYAELLAPLPGFYPQVIASAERTNRYQISVRVDPHQSGLRPEQIVGHLASLGVEANAGRMPCLALDDRLAAGTVKAAGELPVSRRLAGASITLPMPQNLRREQCEWICRRVRDLQHQRSGPRLAVDVTPSEPSVARVLLRATTSTRFWSIEEKALAYVSAAGERWLAEHVLVPPDALIEAAVSVPEILSALDAMATVDEGDRVGESDLRVLGILPEGDLMLDRSFDEPSQTTDEIDLGSLIESGSSASVGLALTGDGRLRVNKRCATDGIDGNGRPWLRRQFHYLGANGIRDAADLFLLPDRFDQRGGEVVVSMPYADSQSLVESILGGVGADDVLRCLGEMLDPLALQVWQRGVVDATPTYVQQAHADRMRRRLAIARQAHRELHATMQQPWVELNGRALEGFTTLLPKVLEALDLDAVRPRRLTFIHGDLNLYNLLVLESGHGNDRYKMIDPRGTPLWDPDDRDEEVERGDFVYDLAKLKFSFGGFVMIRSRLYDFTRHDEASFELRAKQDHPAITTLQTCDERFVETVRRLPSWAATLDRLGEPSEGAWEMRLALAEAANFIADAACSLGRDTPEEILPLYLLGLDKLNRLYRRCGGEPEVPRRNGPARSREVDGASSVAYAGGLHRLRSRLSQSDPPPWDVLEVLVRPEAVPLTLRMLRQAAGTVLPRDIAILAGHRPVVDGGSRPGTPRVVVHGIETMGQLAAVGCGAGRTRSFLGARGWTDAAIDGLRIVTLAPAADAGFSVFARAGERLLSAAPGDLSPLRWLITQAMALGPTRPGRWIFVADAMLVPIEALTVHDGEAIRVVAVEPGVTDGPSSRLAACFLPPAGCAAIERWAAGTHDASVDLEGLLAATDQSDRRVWWQQVVVGGTIRRPEMLWRLTRQIRAAVPTVRRRDVVLGDECWRLSSDVDYLAFCAATQSDVRLKTFSRIPSTLASYRRHRSVADHAMLAVAS